MNLPKSTVDNLAVVELRNSFFESSKAARAIIANFFRFQTQRFLMSKTKANSTTDTVTATTTTTSITTK
jgi:hypothetical protein